MKTSTFGYALSFGVASALLAGCGGAETPIGAPSVPQQSAMRDSYDVCSGHGSMLGSWLTVRPGDKSHRAFPRGLTPANLQAAYDLPSMSNGNGQIVALLEVCDNPNVASDQAEYRSEFQLPSGKFYKFNEYGQRRNYPPARKPLGAFIDGDVEMIAAVCPNCTIDLIEANSFYDLLIAEKEAVTLGAHIVSNSWYCIRCWRGRIKSAFDTPGVVYLAIGGDNNYASYGPAKLDNVVSVGGTILAKRGSKYKEIVWPSTGGGCAKGVAKPSWQHDPGCAFRTQNDVAAVAWGVAEYDSYGGYRGWMTSGGTSVSTPLIAAVYALAGNANSRHAGKRFWTLTTEQRKRYLHAITEGSDGSCGGSYLCTAGTGQYGTYSGPAGWGTPNGIGAF